MAYRKLRNLGRLGNLGIFFPSFLLPSFQFWVLGQNRKVGREKVGTKFRAFRGFQVFDLAIPRPSFYWHRIEEKGDSQCFTGQPKFQNIKCLFSTHTISGLKVSFKVGLKY